MFHMKPLDAIPLRPNPSALRTAAFTSLTRAALALARPISNTPAGQAPPPVVPLDDRAARLLLRSATEPLTTGDASALQNIAIEFLTALTQVSAGAKVLASGLQLSFGRNVISCPTISPDTVASFLREGDVIPMLEYPIAPPLKLPPCKVGAITVLTNEMVLSPNAEPLIRQGMIASAAPAIDAALFSATAGSDLQPAGLRAGISALTPAAGTSKAETLDDLAKLSDAIKSCAGGGITFAMAVPQFIGLMRAPQKCPYPTFPSAALSTGTVIAVASDALVGALDPPRIEAAKSTVEHYETVPADITTPGAISYPVKSTFQTNSVSLRLIMPVSWALRIDDGAVAWMENVSW